MTEKELTYQQLGIAPSDIYQQMGYHDVQPDLSTIRETAAVVDEVSHWLKARFCFFVARDRGDFQLGRIIEGQLAGAEAYAFFLCTAGVEYENYQQRLTQEGDMVRVFIADALGSVIAERCANLMEQSLQESIDKLQWHHTNRFSPGYCGWHVSEQQRLFPLFGGHTCGITLTESSLMVPIKSVSGIVGLGRNVRRLDYTCRLCNFEKCYKRKRPATS